MIERQCHVAAFLACLAVVPAHSENVRTLSVRYNIDPPSASVSHSRAIHIHLRGSKPDITVSGITLRLNEVLRAARPDLPESLTFKNYTNPTETDEIHLGNPQNEVELVFSYEKGSFWRPLISWNLIQLEPGKETMTFGYRAKAFDGPAVTDGETLEVMVTAPTLSVTLGGCAGALALALLRLVYRLRSGGDRMDWHAEIRETLIAIGAGGLIAWVLTFLGGLFSGPQLGVQIAATSWKGGFIIGLFSYKIGDILAQKLWGHDKAPQPEAAAAISYK